MKNTKSQTPNTKQTSTGNLQPPPLIDDWHHANSSSETWVLKDEPQKVPVVIAAKRHPLHRK